ncbi:PP2C family protein-serine/threonine phosphatase [Aeromicrobium wangtongii]|uniref:Serine/threonine-protein phosphatase n=1 Tax=Aeromicrobium wangtongii TaxID=2969247 RepID=A0ABY5M9C7_9ACTN|nr:PP2C family protein-serine/threonine phosphatase [Aeromicrobium wangtongii]MCD9197238.1 serine/threonine-protein phosphatase [Aeromicrobium wangtongii]UUP14734.1 serine/threonine-protein phosphatase [Aeromicrobium wangtongii]
MNRSLRRALPSVARYLDERIVRWRTGTSEGQAAVFLVLLALSGAILVASLVSYTVFPAATFVIPLLLGAMALRYRPLLTLVLVIVVCVAVTVVRQYFRAVEMGQEGITAGRISNLVTMAVVAALVLYESSRHRSGLPGPLGEAMLVDLRDRLQAQGVVPALPDGWRSQSAMISSGGTKFAGDFLVANLSEDETRLEMVLVDVCGKGVAAGTQSLQFAGALGGLIGALPPLGLFSAGNDFLLRQNWDDGFATAVHVLIDLRTGEYSITNAGHPPALRWDAPAQEWVVDGARGTALGIVKRPDLHQTTGRLEVGDALMFYTDGVVESRSQDFTSGIQWLRATAKDVVRSGFDQAPRNIINHVVTGDDDRAVLILDRSAVAARTSAGPPDEPRSLQYLETVQPEGIRHPQEL